MRYYILTYIPHIANQVTSKSISFFSSFVIHNINTSRAREQPVEDPRHSSPRQVPHPPQHHTPLLPPCPSSGCLLIAVPLSLSTKALGLAYLVFLLGEGVALQVYLPARDAVDDLGTVAVVVAALGGHRAHKLGIRLGPLVEVHVRGSDRDSGVAAHGVVQAVRYAD